MGGWPSTTGNPSGGGRWNNEEDDGYDDYDDGGYTPVSTYSARSYSNYTPPTPAQLREYKIDEMWKEFKDNPEKHKMKQRVEKLKDELGYLGRAIGKEYWGYSKWSDMDDIAIKYFKCSSISEFSNTILAPLAEINKKIEAFRQEYGRRASWLEEKLSLPKLSEADHICRKEGFTEYLGRRNDNYGYIWKKGWNDAEESIHLVDREHSNYDITKEMLDNHEDRKAEFVTLQRTKAPLKKRALDAYALFRVNGRNSNNRHFMDYYGVRGQIKSDNLFAYGEKWEHEPKDVDDDLMEIYNLITKDWEELNEERNSLINELNNMEVKVRKEIEELRAKPL